MPLDDQLCFSLDGASVVMWRVYKPMLDKLGITYPQYLMLHSLWKEDGRMIGGIADRLSLEPSTIIPLVKRLAAAGFVARGRDLADKGNMRVTLSERGRALEANSRCLAEEVFAKTGLTVAQMTALTEQVRTLQSVVTDKEIAG